MALFQAQPPSDIKNVLGPFFCPASLLVPKALAALAGQALVHIGPLYFSPSASLVEKMASSDDYSSSVNRP